MKKIFGVSKSMEYPDMFIIKMEAVPSKGQMKGAPSVLQARLLGVSYPTYLKILRDNFGAELVGKNHYYVVPYFTFEKDAAYMVKKLNKIAEEMFTKI